MANDDRPICTVFHKSINRPNLLMGCDRELFLLMATLCAALALGAMTRYTISTAVVIWLVGTFVLRKLTKADPFFRTVYSRHRKYKPFYPARSNYRKWSKQTTATWK